MKIGSYEIDNIYNEDCYEAIKKIPDKSIDLVIIDPPYEYKVGKEEKNKDDDIKKLIQKYVEEGKTLEQAKTWADKVMNRKEIKHLSSGFDVGILNELDKKMKKINIYIWCSKLQITEILSHYEKKGCNFDILTWHKINPLPTCNNTYANDTEYCIFARAVGVLLNGTFETKRKYYVTSLNQKDKKYYCHPTIKPQFIINNFIINSSKENDIVLDCFLGSGTTAVACKELNRHYLGFEISEEYYKIAKDRLNGITQEDRKKEKIGQIKLF